MLPYLVPGSDKINRPIINSLMFIDVEMVANQGFRPPGPSVSLGSSLGLALSLGHGSVAFPPEYAF